MEILKHGKTMRYTIECPICDCEFIADRSEISFAADGGYIRCPDCKDLLSLHLDKMKRIEPLTDAERKKPESFLINCAAMCGVQLEGET